MGANDREFEGSIWVVYYAQKLIDSVFPAGATAPQQLLDLTVQNACIQLNGSKYDLSLPGVAAKSFLLHMPVQPHGSIFIPPKLTL